LFSLIESNYSLFSSTRDLERLVLGKTKAELVANSLSIRLKVEEILGASLEALDLILASCQPA
jgi:hypothetical protein